MVSGRLNFPWSMFMPESLVTGKLHRAAIPDVKTLESVVLTVFVLPSRRFATIR